MFLQFFSWFHLYLELSSHGSSASSAVKIDRNIHACVCVVCIEAPQGGLERAGFLVERLLLFGKISKRMFALEFHTQKKVK